MGTKIIPMITIFSQPSKVDPGSGMQVEPKLIAVGLQTCAFPEAVKLQMYGLLLSPVSQAAGGDPEEQPPKDLIQQSSVVAS